MDFKEIKWVYGIWFVSLSDRDWMCTLSKNKEDKWQIVYRFRYYNKDSENPFDGKDRKSWHSFQSKDGKDSSMYQAVDAINKLVGVMAETKMGTDQEVVDNDFVLIECPPDDEAFFAALSSRSWAHVKKLSPEEYDKINDDGKGVES